LAETTAGMPFGVICFTDPATDNEAERASELLRGHLREGDAVLVWQGHLVAAVAADGSGVRAVLERLASDSNLAAAGLTLVPAGGSSPSNGGVVDLVERGSVDLRSRHEIERSGVRVMVVDDEHPIRVLLRTLLSAEGWLVVEAPSAEAALADFESQRPDIVVTDNHMPGMSGLEFAEALRRQVRDLPIVLFTSAPTPDVADAADALGVRVVAKAVPNALVDEVRSIVELR
jgi:CheY-like chemotaxis protein